MSLKMKRFKAYFLALVLFFFSCDFLNTNKTLKKVYDRRIECENLFVQGSEHKEKFLYSYEIDSSLNISKYTIEESNRKYELDVISFKRANNFSKKNISNVDVSEYQLGDFLVSKNNHFDYFFNFKIDFKKITDELNVISDDTIESLKKKNYYKIKSDNLVFKLRDNSSFHIENHSNVKKLNIIVKIVSDRKHVNIYLFTPFEINDSMTKLLERLK